ncbi:MAG: serine/threonine protein kinase, partial [Actinoallomurus sp.]|nr:serine/threonine protein kinase [Actinoallomurus sp.]
HPELAHDPEFRTRFAREIALLGKIRSAGTVRVLAADADAAQPWFATEYVAGPTLEEQVRGVGPLAGDDLYGLASGLAEALVAMHAAGVVHRDLKPANVILSPSGPRVVDLGIARAVDEAGVTRTGVLIGSPAWLSPEHYRDDEVGPATDVHAWGLLVAFAATGRLPFGSGRPDVLAVRVLRDEVDLTGLDPELRAIASRALSKASEERPSAAELLASMTQVWRRRTDTEPSDLPDADAATVLIQRTWVMPNVEDQVWTLAAPYARPGLGKRRRRPARTLIVASAVVVAAAAAAVTVALVPSRGAESLGRSHNRHVAGAPMSPSVTDSNPGIGPRTPTPRDSASAEAPLQGSRISIGAGISAVAPTGWSVRSGTDGVGPYVCLLMPGVQDNCMRTGVLIESWTGSGSNDQPNLSDPEAWTGDVDPSALPHQCFNPNSSNITGITSETVDSARLRKLGSRSAIFREYHIACGPSFSFHPRIWWLPTTRLMMTVVALPDRYQQTVDGIAASIRFG